MYSNRLLLLLLSSLTGSVLAAQPVVANADSQKPLLGTLSNAEDPGSAADQRTTTTTTFPSNGHAARLNYSSPAPHLFASAYGLLQQWSNTMFPNGHTMAAVEVPPFTLLYHGRTDDAGGAPSPEWLAFDM
ncbi:hypothetical protein ColKHC_11488 [Colletotrichum higginsianum]|nr:hypothetical protein ColKHC_11488 [Colletotrichum higginsianum]